MIAFQIPNNGDLTVPLAILYSAFRRAHNTLERNAIVQIEIQLIIKTYNMRT